MSGVPQAPERSDRQEPLDGDHCEPKKRVVAGDDHQLAKPADVGADLKLVKDRLYGSLKSGRFCGLEPTKQLSSRRKKEGRVARPLHSNLGGGLGGAPSEVFCENWMFSLRKFQSGLRSIGACSNLIICLLSWKIVVPGEPETADSKRREAGAI